MKKTLASLAGMATLGGCVVWVGLAGAQPPQTPIRQTSANAPATGTATAPSPQRPGTSVAVVNMNSVLKGYQKAQYLNNQIKGRVDYYTNLMKPKRDAMAAKQAELSKPTTTPQQRDGYEKEILALQRQLQDIDAEARRVIAEEQGKVAVQIFREIEGVIKAVATANGFDLVLSYPDATTDQPTEMYSQDNVVRKMASQAAIPLFYKPHIDVTNAVVQTLNASYPAPAGATPAAPGTAPATGTTPRP